MEIIEINGPDELGKAARAIAVRLADSPVVALRGSMGAGKTTLVRSLGEAMGVCDEVTSPTFALVNQYCAADGRTINHFDFYRINRLEEAFDMGCEEYFHSGDICLIEWPERIEALLPDGVLNVEIEIADKDRRIIKIG